MGQLVASWGYEVLTASDGRDALEKLGEFTADAIVTSADWKELTNF